MSCILTFIMLELNMKVVKKIKSVYIRNFLMGVEDSLVSTVGLLAGLSSANLAGSIILISGTVLIFVEAFSMGVGSYLSEESVQDFTSRKDKSSKIAAKGGAIMFFSYLAAGIIPLAPYILLQVRPAFILSVVLTMISLFALGGVSAYHFKHKDFLSHGARTLLIGGFAAIIGVVIGRLFNV